MELLSFCLDGCFCLVLFAWSSHARFELLQRHYMVCAEERYCCKSCKSSPLEVACPSMPLIITQFGVASGLGLFPMTFDWAQIAYIGSPLLTPWWAAANVVGGLVIVMWIIAPIMCEQPAQHPNVVLNLMISTRLQKCAVLLVHANPLFCRFR